uniref:Uncharacterized protein n=1 Tax=Anguilla anguilla TaxID=7936 RepID=A0A0E9XCR1_ANGAN
MANHIARLHSTCATLANLVKKYRELQYNTPNIHSSSSKHIIHISLLIQ